MKEPVASNGSLSTVLEEEAGAQGSGGGGVVDYLV